MSISDDLAAMNPHWEMDFTHGYVLERSILHELRKEIDAERLTVLNGPRRVGKTVLLRQLIDHLVSNRVKRERILYFSFDDSLTNIKSAFRAWESRYGLNLRKGKYYVFLDEVQYVSGWGSQLKFIHENYPNVKAFVSGSSSLLLRKGRESLAGRSREIMIGALSLDEYLLFSGQVSQSSVSFSAYSKYMMSQFPAIALGKDDSIYYVRDVVKKSIYEDMPRLFGTANSEIVNEMFRVICRSPGEIIDYVDMAKDLGVDRDSVSKYFDAMSDSLLVRRLYNYSANARKSETKHKKFYPFITSYHLYTAPMLADESRIAETEVARVLDAEFFWNHRGREIDFLADGKKVSVEVKLRKRVDSEDSRLLSGNPLGSDLLVLVIHPDSRVEIADSRIRVVKLADIQSFAMSSLKLTQ